MKKQTLYAIFGVVIVTLACTFGSATPATPTQVDELGTMVAATMQALTATGPTEAPTEAGGTPISFEYASFVIPNGLADGAGPQLVPEVTEDSGSSWEAAPAHLKFSLSGYPVQGKFHEPEIFVYPAEEFVQANFSAAEQVDRIKKIRAGLALMEETLPFVPFFNATPLTAAQIKIISFQNGSGVRSLTQYAQYAAPINNHELFYHFQGLTDDEKYYVIAILPITAPILPEDEKPDAAVPEGGVSIPTDIGPNDVYYVSVTEKLNSLAPDAYGPSLNALDTLIQSILVTTP